MKKIIAIVAVIATITAILCIGANAYNSGDVLEKDTIIQFSDTISSANMRSIVDIYYETNNENYHGFTYTNQTLTYNNNPDKDVYKQSTGWVNNSYKKIKLTQDYTMDGSGAVLFSSNNVIITTPILTRTINNTSETFKTTLTVATAIIAWLMANQIALVGLYLYILIVLLATGKRYIKGA